MISHAELRVFEERGAIAQLTTVNEYTLEVRHTFD